MNYYPFFECVIGRAFHADRSISRLSIAKFRGCRQSDDIFRLTQSRDLGPLVPKTCLNIKIGFVVAEIQQVKDDQLSSIFIVFCPKSIGFGAKMSSKSLYKNHRFIDFH